ncbi:DUF2207 domain-containing protein [Kribbella sp. NBC_01505]|uniref:DUF2207 domain-containing protein n=1 Tax=Kribbella sp. NBC_01505 TaxID=2903580 RepID=UPI0038644F61
MSKRIAVLVVAVVGVLAPGGVAVAASDDSVDSFRAVHRVDGDGILHIAETIVYRFGSSSGRHGIFRDLVTREPSADDARLDQRYDVSDVSVSSPSGHSAELTTVAVDLDRNRPGRVEGLRLRIGSSQRRIATETATYVIRYQVAGALRHFSDHTEIYWDATGGGWTAPLHSVGITVEVPGGVAKVACFAGSVGTKSGCGSMTSQDGKGRFTHPLLLPGDQLTYVAGIRPGLVRNDSPIVQPAGRPAVPVLGDSDDEVTVTGVSRGVLISAGATAILTTLGATLWVRSLRRDQRYISPPPPGTVPPRGIRAVIGTDELHDEQLPVIFAPPPIPVAEAGFLINPDIYAEQTAATVIDLAFRGALEVQASFDDKSMTLVLADPTLARPGHEKNLLQELFDPLVRGETTILKGVADSAMSRAHFATADAVRAQVMAHGWYARPPAAAPTLAGCLVPLSICLFGLIAGVVVGHRTRHSLDWLILLVAFCIATHGIHRVLAARERGRRSAAGRAIADQIVGFRTYLATAEADQLRFDEGEDIFSRYLPWAIVYGLTDRWQEVCGQLITTGRIPGQSGWYSGPSLFASPFTAGVLTEAIVNSLQRPDSSLSGLLGSLNSSTRGGGGLGSRGAAGGGGGGGGGGSW